MNMARLNVVDTERATGEARVLYDGISGVLGMVPNIYQGVANSPAALEGLLQIGAALKKGQLAESEIEAIKLAVSQAYGCRYCLGAHTFLAKKAGLSDAEIIDIRLGNVVPPRLAALIRFVNVTIEPRGRITDDDLGAVKTAGYNDAQVAEVILVIAQTVFTNLFNRVHQTPLDFPPAPEL